MNMGVLNMMLVLVALLLVLLQTAAAVRGQLHKKVPMTRAALTTLTRKMAPTSITKHLTTGDALPPLKPGVLRLYSMKFCPYADRARLVLHAKGIEHEVVNVNTWEKPTWFVNKNPLKAVPVIEQDDKIVYESLIVARYLDNIFPDKNKLSPKDPYQQAKDEIVLAFFEGKVITAFWAARGGNQEKIDAFKNGLKYLDDELKKRGTDYFFGAKPGYLDYMMWPIFARTSAMGIVGPGQRVPASLDTLGGWVNRMLKDESVKSIIHPDSVYQEFIKHYRTDNTLFDEISTPN